MVRVKEFLDKEDLEGMINAWINANSDFIEVIDIKYSVCNDGSSERGGVTSGALIIYKTDFPEKVKNDFKF